MLDQPHIGAARSLQITAVIFDLDGTLIDSLQDIARSVNLALEEHGERPHPLEDFPAIIGGGAELLLRKILPESAHPRLPQILATYRVHYAAHMLDHTRPYPGIRELLQELQRRRIAMAVLSNKLDGPTQTLVKTLFPGVPLSPVFGERAGVPRKPDPTSALEVASMMGHPPERCAFVGDTWIDMETAVNARMIPVGVEWGFRPDRLSAAGARQILSHPKRLLDLLG